MTRVLSELLGAREPLFRRGISRLESASGHAGADIRLSTEVQRAAQYKLRELNLDPHDTTGLELYAALQQRVKSDDARLSAALARRYGMAAPHRTVGCALADLPVAKQCFGLKTATGRQILKALLPRHAMKALGYRSFDSMMRREPLLAVYAAGWLLEPAGWRKAVLESYRKLHATDFETRPLTLITPDAERWHALAQDVVTAKKHTIVGLREFGAIVILPLPLAVPPAATLTSLLLALHEMNEVRAAGTFLKFSQARPDFGRLLQTAVADESSLGVELLGGPLPWQIIYRYYARFAERFQAEIFEPFVQREDLAWHSVEKVLQYIAPDLHFWQHTATLGVLHQHRPVSMNITDAALSFCNQLPYENRIVHYFRHGLWHELVMRYLKHENVEQAVLRGLESQLATGRQLL